MPPTRPKSGLAEAPAAVFVPLKPLRPEKSEGGKRLKVVSDMTPKGDQPTAIKELVANVLKQERDQVLLDVTGSGKTFTMAKVIEATQRPALILAPKSVANTKGRRALPRSPGGAVGWGAP